VEDLPVVELVFNHEYPFFHFGSNCACTLTGRPASAGTVAAACGIVEHSFPHFEAHAKALQAGGDGAAQIVQCPRDKRRTRRRRGHHAWKGPASALPGRRCRAGREDA
jgi:hypothetical protein